MFNILMQILEIMALVLKGLFEGFVAAVIVLGLLYVPGITFFLLVQKLRRKHEDNKQDKE